jgi:hypothetical protein
MIAQPRAVEETESVRSRKVTGERAEALSPGGPAMGAYTRAALTWARPAYATPPSSEPAERCVRAGVPAGVLRGDVASGSDAAKRESFGPSVSPTSGHLLADHE